MARMGAKVLESILNEIQKSAVRGARKAAEFCQEQLKHDVGMACPATHGQGRYHSPTGGPPYLESGEGQKSIMVKNIKNGAVIYLIPTPNHGKLTSGNQLEYHDQHERPWFKGRDGKLFNRRYGNVVKNIIKMEMAHAE